MRRKTALLRLGLAGLVGLLALGGKCRLWTPTGPQVWARLVRVTYTRPAELVYYYPEEPRGCPYRTSPNNVLVFAAGAGAFPPDEVHLGPPDVLVWHRSLGDRRFVEGAWIEMNFSEGCAPADCDPHTGYNLEPEVEVPPGYRLEREVVVYAPCGAGPVWPGGSYLRLRIVRAE